VLDAVVTAAGRFDAAEAARCGTAIKALARVGGKTLLEIVVTALRGVREIARIVVVGPAEARPHAPQADAWIDERQTGEENLLAALRAATTARLLFSASDMPFVTSAAYADLIARAGPTIAAAYPVYRRHDFERAYPGCRRAFTRLADGEWTGGSAFVLDRAAVLRRAALVTKGFAARKSTAALAALLGLRLTVRFALGAAHISDVERRVSSLLQAPAAAIEGADPALALDCDTADEIVYAQNWPAAVTN
jgi:CTP:molybdopterin cytidylyltransferase MocA